MMDPTATIAEIARILAELQGPCTAEQRERLNGDIANLLEALGEWILKGGFLPTLTGPVLGKARDGEPIVYVDDHIRYTRFAITTGVDRDLRSWFFREYRPYNGQLVREWTFPSGQTS